MKVERLSDSQIKYSIYFDDLGEAYFNDDLYWDEFVANILDEARTMFQLEWCDNISIEVHSLTDKELILLLTKENEKRRNNQNILGDFMIFSFNDIEELILLAIDFRSTWFENDMYYFDGKYYLVCKGTLPKIYAICTEYGEESYITSTYLSEYGKILLEKNALEQLKIIFQ